MILHIDMESESLTESHHEGSCLVDMTQWSVRWQHSGRIGTQCPVQPVMLTLPACLGLTCHCFDINTITLPGPKASGT